MSNDKFNDIDPVGCDILVGNVCEKVCNKLKDFWRAKL